MGFTMVLVNSHENTIDATRRILCTSCQRRCTYLGVVSWSQFCIVDTYWYLVMSFLVFGVCLGTNIAICPCIFGRCGLRWPPRGSRGYGSWSTNIWVTTEDIRQGSCHGHSGSCSPTCRWPIAVGWVVACAFIPAVTCENGSGRGVIGDVPGIVGGSVVLVGLIICVQVVSCPWVTPG